MAVLRLDPTRTTGLRKKFMTQLRKRFLRLRRAVLEYIYVDDTFGLEPVTSEFTFNVAREFEFLSNPDKVRQFKIWLKGQVDAGILEVGDEFAAKPWLAPTIESAYKKGATRAYIDATKGTSTAAGQSQFLAQSFSAPVTTQKIELLYTRAFDDLKGITDAMSTEMGRIFADGVAHGHGPRQIAVELNRTVDKMTKRRALTLARTEVVHAHAEGQLDSFDRLGIEELNAMVEFSTAGDHRVCQTCQDLEGETFTTESARGVIPVHPNCRCAWIPAL